MATKSKQERRRLGQRKWYCPFCRLSMEERKMGAERRVCWRAECRRKASRVFTE